MKKQVLSVFVLAVLFTSCQNSSQSNKEAADTTAAQPQAKMETMAGPAVALEGSKFIPNTDAQTMITAYNGNPLATPTTYFLVDAQQVKDYIIQAESKQLKDLQLLFARHTDGQVTLVISAVKADGKHIPYIDSNNIQSALEHVMPCPPGTNCEATTNLNDQ